MSVLDRARGGALFALAGAIVAVCVAFLEPIVRPDSGSSCQSRAAAVASYDSSALGTSEGSIDVAD
jgi:hypothetical protein